MGCRAPVLADGAGTDAALLASVSAARALRQPRLSSAASAGAVKERGVYMGWSGL